MIYTFYGNESYSDSDVYRNNTIAGFVLGILSIVVLILFSPYISLWFNNNELTLLIGIFALSIPFSIVYQSINSTLIYFKLAKTSSTISVISNIVRLSLMLIALKYTKSLSMLFIAMVIGYVLQYLMGIFAIRKLQISNGKINIDIIKKQLSVGSSFGVISIIGVALLYSTSFVISSLEGPEMYAVFRNGAFEIPLLSTLYGSIGTAILPDMVRMYNEKKYSEIIALNKKAISHTSLFIIPIVVFILFYHRPLITIYLSDKYIGSSIIFMIYSLTLLIRLTNYENIFVASSKSSIVLKSNLIALIINIVLSVILVMKFSIIGAVIASVLSTYFVAIFLMYHTLNILQCKFSDLVDLSKLFKISFFSLFFVTLSTFIYQLIPTNITVFAALFGLFVSLFIYSTYKRLYDISLLSNLKSKGLIPEFIWTRMNRMYL